MDVFEVCPHLVPQNSNLTLYNGFITVLGESFQLSVKLEAANELKGASIDCEWKLRQLLRPYKHVIQQRLQQCTSLASFLVELKSIIERQLRGHKSRCVQPPPKFYSKLLEEIEELGWHRLVYVDETFQKLHLVAVDGSNRRHTLKLHLHQQHPEQAPECNTELPHPLQVVWTSKSCLRDVYVQFEKSLVQYQELWSQLDDLDTKTWVLEPEKPTRNATHRRIALGNSASLQIEVDPNHCRMLPDCRFMGADHVINPLRENLNNNLHKWNPEESLLTNLSCVLQVEFPSPSNTKKEDFSVECGICYAYRLDDQIPDQVCDDSRCAQPFHHACLYEWLRALPSSRQSFNMVFGECPYCNKPITVKMPTR